jgi:hypothetical protein
MEKEELEVEAREVADQISIWRSLIESPGWKRFEETVSGQMSAHRARLNTPLESLDKVPEQEFMKGELSRAGLLLGLPETQLEILKAQAEHLQKEMENVQEELVADGRSERERNDRWERGPVDEHNDPFSDGG